MPAVTDQPVSAKRSVHLHIAINEEVRWQLGTTARLNRMTMADYLHQVLCEALERKDLLALTPSKLADDEAA